MDGPGEKRTTGGFGLLDSVWGCLQDWAKKRYMRRPNGVAVTLTTMPMASIPICALFLGVNLC